MSIKVFNKLIEQNEMINHCISTVISEYDIASAHTSAMYFIYGENTYKQLMSMPKLNRNIEIGKMIGNDKSGNLIKEIQGLILKWFNLFCKENSIHEQNFISSTRDSIMIVNKKPTKTVFENGIVKFRNKDGEYTSYIRIKDKENFVYEVLFDRISGRIHIKGINESGVSSNPYFIKLLKKTIAIIEQNKEFTYQTMLKKLSSIRNDYLNPRKIDMYRSIKDKGKYIYLINGERFLSDNIMEESDDVKFIYHENYEKFIMPLFSICLKRY